MKNKSHQLKSRWYYIFWGIIAVAVVGGQIYVGSGYRQMSGSVNRLTGLVITLMEAI
jgi:hypothetical protein